MISRREFFALTASTVTLIPVSMETYTADKTKASKASSGSIITSAVKHHQDLWLLKYLRSYSIPARTDKIHIQEPMTEKEE